MKEVPDGDRTPIVTPPPVTAALAITAAGTLVLGVLPGLVLRFADIQDLTGVSCPLTDGRGHPVRALHGAGPLRSRRVLHAGRAGRPARRLPHLPGGRAAVRRRAGPLPRRRVAASRAASPFTVVDVGAGPGTLARSIVAAAPECRAALRYIAVEVADVQRRSHPAGVESRAELPAESHRRRRHRQRAARQPAVPPGRVRWRLAGGVRVAAADGTLTEVLSAPFDPVPDVLPATPPLGARAPLIDAARAWLDGARGLVRSGSVIAFDYTRRHDGRAGPAPVAGVAAHLPPARAGRALPRRARRAGPHHGCPARPAAGA